MILKPDNEVQEKQVIHSIHMNILSIPELLQLHHKRVRPSELDAIEQTAWLDDDNVYCIERTQIYKSHKFLGSLTVRLFDDKEIVIFSKDSTFSIDIETLSAES